MGSFRIKIPDVKERLRKERSLTSNLIYTIWAVFGGFILHFLLCNYLTVLLRPSYEKPVETAADLINRNIHPFYAPGGEFLRNFFAASPDPNYQEISRRLVIAKDLDDYEDMVQKVTSTGMFAEFGPLPYPRLVSKEDYIHWYRSSETIGGLNPYGVHLINKKWPLKEVLQMLIIKE